MNNKLPSVLTASILVTAMASGIACAEPDFSGVWNLSKPQDALTTLDGKTPPLLPDALKAYQETSAKRKAGDLSWDGVKTLCKPPGEPRILLEGMPFQIVQQPDKLFFAYQWNRLDRMVALNRPAKVIGPTYFSTSSASWDGDALVIKAEDFNGKIKLDRNGMPSSKELKLEERLTLSKDGKTLTMRIHVTDPNTFSAPWDTQLTFTRQHEHLQEDVCEIREGIYTEG
jgi:hypothetical protein